MNNGNSNNNNRTNTNRVRAVCASVVSSASEPVTYDIPFSSIVTAFEDCIKKKMSSKDCLAFFCTYQSELKRLWNEVRTGRYYPGTSKCFVVKWPVYREVFAADFADRVMHHWWALRVNPLFEKRFTEQGNVSKNCRKGEGTLAAIKAVQRMINEHPDWWVGHFDFEGYFMSMNKGLLYEMLEIFIRDHYTGDDLECLIYITRITVFHCPQDDCIRKSPIELWEHIPPRKTLFGQPKSKGCAIGNLPSQLNANFLGSVFDYWIREIKGVEHYIRFVDDITILLPTRELFSELLPGMKQYLKEQLLINLHPKKIYIQPAKNGVLFVGAMILPGRTYISNRTRGKMYDCIRKYNKIAEDGRAFENLEKFVQSMNSYLGMMVHFNSYKIRKRVMYMIHKEWWKYIMLDGKFRKFIIKRKYKTSDQLRQIVRRGDYKYMLTPILETPV